MHQHEKRQTEREKWRIENEIAYQMLHLHDGKTYVKKKTIIANQMTKLHGEPNTDDNVSHSQRAKNALPRFPTPNCYSILCFYFHKISYISTFYGRLNVIYVHSFSIYFFLLISLIWLFSLWFLYVAFSAHN